MRKSQAQASGVLAKRAAALEQQRGDKPHRVAASRVGHKYNTYFRSPHGAHCETCLGRRAAERAPASLGPVFRLVCDSRKRSFGKVGDPPCDQVEVRDLRKSRRSHYRRRREFSSGRRSPTARHADELAICWMKLAFLLDPFRIFSRPCRFHFSTKSLKRHPHPPPTPTPTPTPTHTHTNTHTHTHQHPPTHTHTHTKSATRL
jgi:hypothetical protein